MPRRRASCAKRKNFWESPRRRAASKHRWRSDAMSDESIFAAALSKAPGAERRAFLDGACGGDDASAGASSACSRPTTRPAAFSNAAPTPARPRPRGGRAVALARTRLRRPLQAAPEARRRGHGRGLGRRPGRAGAAPRRRQGDSPRPRLRADARPLRPGAAGAGPDGPPQHRQGPGRRRGREVQGGGRRVAGREDNEAYSPSTRHAPPPPIPAAPTS